MSLPIGSVVTDVTLESLSASNQSNVPFTFGQVFKQGDILPSESLTGRIGKDSQPLQYEVKATHNDGSVRHAIISGVLPSLAAKAAPVMQLVKTTPSEVFAATSTPCTASVTTTIGGVSYTATVDNKNLPNTTWLSGSIVQERHFNVPLSTSAGATHPHLFARFALRDYNGNVRVDLTVENNWTYEKDPQSFTYNVEVSVNGEVKYKADSLTHLHHARWRKVMWASPAGYVNVKLNIPYLISTKAVPNYDQEVKPSESVLAAYGTLRVDPMQIGLSNSYMPMTGGNDGIGVLPAWAAAYVLSMDDRAKNATLSSGAGAGSYSMHYRDKKTDFPVTLTDHPRMTIAGRNTDAGVDAFPQVINVVATPYTHDVAHQPSLAYLPYLVTGDYFYLEELQFWAMYDAFASNPGYRGVEQGLLIPEQLRGQAWAIRTLSHAAYITPDTHPLKKEITRILNCNFDWYNSTYSNNPSANKLGIITNGYAIGYNNDTATAPWQDDFFTSAMGNAVDLGFEKAKPIMAYKAKFPVGRMTAPGVCWVTAVPYTLTVRDTSTSPIYETFLQAYTHDLGESFMDLPCATRAMAVAWKAKAMYAGPAIAGDMANISEGYMGYPSNLQPALAYSVDAGVEGSKQGWDYFMSRSVKPDYSLGSQFNIIPRSYKAGSVPLPNEPVDPLDGLGTWKTVGKEGDILVVPEKTIMRYGANGFYVTKTMSGRFTVNNLSFGEDPLPNVAKIAQEFTPNIPIIEEPKMTFKVIVALSFANQTLPHGTEAQASKTLVEILAADGKTVVASSTDTYEFGGVNAGSYVVRASGIDSKGAVMGVPYTQAFTIVEEVVVPPVDTTPVEVSLPAGVTVSWTKE